MESHDTDPDLATLLIDMLCSWRDEATLPNTPAYGLELLAIRQQELGGQALLEGRMSYEWEANKHTLLLYALAGQDNGGQHKSLKNFGK
jgi:hypothetical protein